jgi:enamine deaminase RidA (YjgF/YER057c/UK114 family)
MSDLVLPDPMPPFGRYVPSTRAGDLLFTAGHFAVEDGAAVTGKLGVDLDAERGYEVARLAALSLLATVQEALGDLDRVEQVVRVYGVVNAAPDFTEHTRVIDGASDLLERVFGGRGRHARLAVGVASLPANLALEVEAVLHVR